MDMDIKMTKNKYKNWKKGVIVNNARFGFGKDYRIFDRDKTTNSGKDPVLLSQQSYATIKDAKRDAKLMKIRIYKSW